MREIKFRAWHKEKKIMGEVLEIDTIHSEICFFNSNVDCSEFADLRHIELMQYTELKDKNDKEIYEGDIITIHNVRAKVIFNSEEARFILKIDEFETGIPFTNNNNLRMEIIGNIYKNPELLGEYE